jgi:sulfur carrier protein
MSESLIKTADRATTATLTVAVNGVSAAVTSATLAELVVSLGYVPASVATAVNGEFVPRARRHSFSLGDGDRVEIVAPRSGG